MELKNMLTAYFAASGESLTAFALRAGVSRATVYRARSGDYGDYARMQRMVDALGAPLVILPRAERRTAEENAND